jgi:hypothetical protein
MSPDEDQLRTALHEGQGGADELDARRIMSSALVEQARRRHSLRSSLAIAAAVIVVAGGTTGIITALAHSGSSGSSSAASREEHSGDATYAGGSALTNAGPSSAAASSPADAPATSRPAAAGAPNSSAPAACPATPPNIDPPRPGGTGAGALFAKTLTALTICVYQPDGSGVAGGETFTGADADSVAATFNSIAAADGDRPCPSDLGPTVLMLPRTAGGPGAAVVGNVGGCGTTTNGTAVRYARTQLTALIQKVLPGTVNSGRASPGPGPAS